MPERPEQPEQSQHPDQPERPEEPVGHDPDRKTFDLDFSFESTQALPPGALSPELIERLRSGMPPSPEDLAQIRLATAGRSGMAGMLLEAMSAAGFVKSEEVDGGALPVPAEFADDASVVVVPGGAQKFTWTWGGGGEDPGPEPATYFEALTGRPDPMREVLVTARRTLDIITWILAIGLPVGLVLLAVLTRQSAETIFFAGFGGLVVGLMVKASLPRTPFR